MPYIGNTIRAADDYRLIDDISSSFNGSTTSFALQVAGSAPVPFPKSPQQVLISVNGVIQEPDPTGASGFNLVGTNIVFSSAPTNGHAFFGIIYATADYLNSGGNFPAGSLGAPSITFVGDEDTGIYRKGSGSIGFVADSTEIANTDSNGITISSGNLILPADIIHNGDTDTKIRFSSNDQISLETGGNEKIRINNSTYIQLYDHIVPNNDSTKDIGLTGTRFRAAYVDNYYGSGANLTGINTDLVSDTSPQLGGNLDVNTKNIVFGDSGGATDDRLTFGAGTDLSIYHNGSDSYIEDSGTGALVVKTNQLSIRNAADDEQLAKFIQDSAVELYHDNTKRFETGSLGARFFGNLYADDSEKLILGSGTDFEIFHDGTASRLHSASHPFYIRSGGQFGVFKGDGTESMIVANPDGSVDLYHNNNKKFETHDIGTIFSQAIGSGGTYGAIKVNTTLDSYGGITVRDATHQNVHTSAFQVENNSSGANETNLLLRSVNLGSTEYSHGLYAAKSHRFAISNNTTPKVQIDLDGLKFNNDQASANALNDYEEGTWTPNNVNFSTYTNVTWDATYIKIGSSVFFNAVQTGGDTNWGNSQALSNLPFAVEKTGAGTWTNNAPSEGGSVLIWDNEYLYFSPARGAVSSNHKLRISGVYQTNE